MKMSACILAALLALTCAACPAQDAYAPLALYNGPWITSKSGAAAPDHLVNHCVRTGLFYSCEQVVNGKTAAIVIFVPAGAPGTYHTQAVLPSGRATGRGDLTIHGTHWVFLGKDVEKDKTTWYKTTNDFKDNNHIHFEQSQSTDGTHWTVTGSGDEVRAQ